MILTPKNPFHLLTNSTRTHKLNIMLDKKTWVRFKKPGVAIGYAHHEGDVAEIDATKADEGMEAGVLVRAKPAEIEAAKQALVALEASASRATTAPSVSDSALQSLLAQMKGMQDEIDRLNAAAAKPAQPATLPAA